MPIYHTFILTVNSLATNHPPNIKKVANATVKVGDIFTLKLNGSDQDVWDAVNLTFRLESGPTGMIVAANGMVMWTPMKDQIGKQNVTVGLSDGKNSTTATFNLTVEPATTNGPSNTPAGPSFVWIVIILVICLLIGAAAIYMVKRKPPKSG